MNKKAIGIIGGMGPMATAELFRQIIANTKSDSDQEHIRIYIDNNTRIPDRTAAILGCGESPVAEIVDSAKKLESIGADFLIMPCNTSHYFLEDIQSRVDIKILNMISLTAQELKSRGIKKAGLLATTGTICGLAYEKYFEPFGIELLYPDSREQEAVMSFIYSGVKAGAKNYDVSEINRIVGRLTASGAETIILGCTELPVGKTMYGLNFPSTDTLEVLAKAAIREAGYDCVQETHKS